jgi:nitrate/nitrite transporter NarK
MTRVKLHYGWIVVAVGLLVAIGAHGFGRMSYTLILPAMKDGLALSYAQTGLLGTGNFVGYVIMALVGGLLAARHGARLVIALALVFMGLTLLATALADSFSFALAMRFLTGLGNGAAYVPAMALGSVWFAARRRGLATGVVSGGIGGGTMIASLIVPPILASGGEAWRSAWGWLGALVLAIALLAGLFLRNRPEDLGLAPVGATPQPEPAGPAAAKAGALQWSLVYTSPRVWFLGLVYLMYGFSYVIYMTFFAAYLTRELGLSPATAGGLWALVGGLSIFCGVLWGAVSDALGRAKGSALAYLCLGGAYVLMALGPTPAGYHLSAVVFGLSAWSIPTIMAAAAGDLVGPRLAPAGLGFVTLFFGLGQTVGPWVGGRLADLQGSFQASFLLAAGVSALGALLSLGLKAKAR